MQKKEAITMLKIYKKLNSNNNNNSNNIDLCINSFYPVYRSISIQFCFRFNMVLVTWWKLSTRKWFWV